LFCEAQTHAWAPERAETQRLQSHSLEALKGTTCPHLSQFLKWLCSRCLLLLLCHLLCSPLCSHRCLKVLPSALLALNLWMLNARRMQMTPLSLMKPQLRCVDKRSYPQPGAALTLLEKPEASCVAKHPTAPHKLEKAPHTAHMRSHRQSATASKASQHVTIISSCQRSCSWRTRMARLRSPWRRDNLKLPLAALDVCFRERK